MKKGDILYNCYVDEYEGTIELREWHVTHVDSRGAFLTWKIERITWGKRSSKHHDYGFFKNVDPMWRKKLRAGENYKDHNLHKSKPAARRAVLPELKKKAAKLNRMVSTLERQIKK